MILLYAEDLRSVITSFLSVLWLPRLGGRENSDWGLQSWNSECAVYFRNTVESADSGLSFLVCTGKNVPR